MSIEAPIEPSSGHRTLLADGTVVLVRRLERADRDAVLRLHTELRLADTPGDRRGRGQPARGDGAVDVRIRIAPIGAIDQMVRELPS